jgi:origin recognition complex subunit 3
VLLFGIATSVENLQDRLSQSAVRCLAGQQFDVVQADEILELIFTTATINGSPTLRIGAQLSNMLLQRHHENLLSAQDFVDSIQYAYMSHFYANPLSVFMSKDIDLEDVSKEHIEALRNVPSFRKSVHSSHILMQS